MYANMIKRNVSRYGSSVWSKFTRQKVVVGVNIWSEFVGEVKKSVH